MKKVICAMSGGVDSSVAAALLKRAGFDVVGVFMKFWAPSEKNGLIGTENRCCSPEAEVRARKVAKILKIPFYVFDFSKEFKERIVDYFLEGYKKGITPNPCVVCNKEIKFGLLLEKALKLGADFVATGHYARKIQNPKSKIQKLLMAKDKKKDQSYFLWMLNQKQLKRILFPIGDLTRKEVENLAKKFKLPVLKAKKSVEICFIQTTINDFLKKYLKEKPGKIIDTQGKILGEHKGLWFYTIGQRKGILLSGGPYFVLDKDLKKNVLIVTKNERDLYKKELICKNVNWISGRVPRLPLKIKAKIRYRHQPGSAILTKNLEARTYKLVFSKSQRAITPGQSVVFYKGQELLGGGMIF
jgi:tRNA-specific 2-thiouridylase